MRDIAFSPCRIGSITIKNRFVMTAANLGWCPGGYVNDRVTAFYRERAEGGAGLIIAGAAGVDPVRVNTAGMMQIYDDCFIPKLMKLTDEVHKAGGKIFLQLMHAGAYAKSTEHAGAKALAPGAFLCRFTGEQTQILEDKDIEDIASWFGAAGLRARKAGFDGVEVIGSAGYLVAEFLSKATNQRKDAYGGDINHRTAFLVKVIEAIRAAAGTDYPLIVRLSGTDFIPDGNGPEEFLAVGKRIEGLVDAIDVTGGWHESSVPQITWHVPRGQYLYLAKALKEAVSVPVIGCNRLDARTAMDAIDNEFCDFAGLLRAWIADPRLADKAGQRQEEAITPCLACNQDCLERIFSGKDLACVVNPLAGREYEKLRPGLQGKKILVIGAGPAGLTCAHIASSDNQVDVWEKDYQWGGAGRVVSRLPCREDVAAWIDGLYDQCVRKGVRFKFGHEASEEELAKLLQAGCYDCIVIACGAIHEPAARACLSGEVEARVILAEDCIRDMNPCGKRILVLGSGYKAVQTVQYLLSCGDRKDQLDFLETYAPDYRAFAEKVWSRQANQITLLASGEKIGQGFGKSVKWLMLHDLKRSAAHVIRGAAVERITKDTLYYRHDGQVKAISYDIVVDAVSWRNNDLFKKLLQDFPDKLILIGDARRPARFSEAVKDAFDAVYQQA